MLGMALPNYLWEHFVVIGLRHDRPLQTVHGEPGFLGAEARYQPGFIDSLPHISEASSKGKQLAPQLPTCCLPAGVDVVLHQDLATTNLMPHTYAVVLTEGNGTKVYASCLSFYDHVPHALAARHEDLLGSLALKAICLLSHQPYLTTADKVLRELYNAAFVCGSSVPFPEVINSVLAVPLPRISGPKVCLRLGSSERLLCPPLATGPTPGEVSLQPLLEVLRPDNLVGLFAAVLLEQRVLLRSRHQWLLTVAAECVVRLLQPLQYHHVYIPVMPYNLTDYLEAPTPFLMGLHSGEYVDAHVLDTLVVVDLDADTLRPSKADTLLQRCRAHPYMLQLSSRVRMLMQPAVTDVDAVGQHTDPWTLAAQQMAGQPWGPSKQALLLRIFLEFFRSVLDGYQGFLIPGSCDGSRTAPGRALSGVQQGLLHMQKRASGVAGNSGSGASSLPAVPPVRSSVQLAPLQQLCRVDLPAVMDHHAAQCGRSDPALLQQVMQGLPFLSFVAERGCADSSQGWLTAAEDGLRAWREAEEQLQAAHASQHTMLKLDEGTDVLSIPQRAHLLVPPADLVYRSFPALILVEYGEGPGLRLRRIGNTSKKRQSVGKRRAISELMGSPIDLRRKSPVPDLLNELLPPPQQWAHLRDNGLETLPLTASPAAAGVGPMTGGSSSSCTSGCGNRLSMELGEYSAEADVVRRQTGLLVQLMQPAASNIGCTDAASSYDAMQQEADEDLEGARRLLCLQTGGNGWFLVSRLKEIITTGASPTSASTGGNVASRRGSISRPGQRFSGLSVSFYGAATAAGKATPGSPHDPLATSSMPVTQPDRIKENGGSRKGSRRTGKPGTSKSSKLFGGNSSSSTYSGSPPAMKVSQSMESIASAASAMASALSVTVNRSVSAKLKAGSSSRSQSPIADSSWAAEQAREAKAVSVPGSTAGSSTSSKAAPKGSKALEGGAGGRQASSNAGEARSCNAVVETAGVPADVEKPAGLQATAAAAGNNLSVEDLQAETVEAADPAGSGGAGGMSSTDRSLTAAEHSSSWDRRVGAAAFGVLADMLNSIIEVAAVQEDYRAVLAALELSCVITCWPAVGGARRQLISALAGNPVLHTEWLWAGAFSFAVSSSYLQAEELASIRDVVVTCLADLGRYMCGVGISGPAAWLLLMQLATEHLPQHSAVEPDILLALRAHLTCMSSIASQDLHRLPQPLPPVAAQAATAGYAAAGGRLVAAAKQLPADVVSGLEACGLDSMCGMAGPAGGMTATAADGEEEWTSVRSCPTKLHDPPAVHQQQQQQPQPQFNFIPGPPSSSAVKITSRQPGSASPAGPARPACLRPAASVADTRRGSVDDHSDSTPAASASNLRSPRTAGVSRPLSPRGLSRLSPRDGLQQYQYSTSRCAAKSYQLCSASAKAATAAEEATAAEAAAAAEAEAAAAAETCIAVGKVDGGLLQQGAMQWAALHSAAVVAIDASNYTVLSVSLDGSLKVTDTSSGTMQLSATMQIPALHSSSTSGSSAWPSGFSAMPVVKLWRDGSRAAIGNARSQAVWVVDLHGAAATTELSGLGSSFSALHLLQRNKDALLTGLSRPSSSCRSSNSESAAAAYIWDLRKPKKAAASLDLPAVATAAGSNGGSVCSLTVHEDGVLAAAGCSSGSVLVWDMRQPSKPLVCCTGHCGPVTQATFLPAAAAAAAAAEAGTSAVPSKDGSTITQQRPLPLLLTGSDDWTARLWDASTGSCQAVCVGHGGALTAATTAVASPSRGSSGADVRLVTGAADGTVGVWGLRGELHGLMQQHHAQVCLLAQGDATLVSGAADRTCAVWGLDEVLCCNPMRMPQPLASQARPAAVALMAMDPVGELLAAGHRDGSVSVWNCGGSAASKGGL